MKKFLIVLAIVAMASLLMGVGCFPKQNLPPEITSYPVKTATVGVAYTYDVDATDPNPGDILTYSLIDEPNGMLINATSGVITWTPAVVGDFDVTVEVSDGDLSDTQDFTIVVKEPPPGNQAPVIDSIPITTATVGVKYTYTIKATDPEGDKITYSLVSWPVGMGFNGIATISWTPTKEQVGLHDVTVEASDGELSTPQCFTIVVNNLTPVEVCPTVGITSEVAVGGKKYIGIGEQTVTVTFDVPTEPVSVIVGYDLKGNIELFPGYEVVMYPNEDKTVYTGDFVFGESSLYDCSEAYIYVETCETCDYCKYPYTVDKVAPFASIEIIEKEGICEGESSIKFDSAWGGINGCEPPVGGCCDDDCSGLASWTIDIYDLDPKIDDSFACCAELLYSGEGEACPVLWVTDCADDWYPAPGVTGAKFFYAIIELKDVVGNSTKYYAKLIFDLGIMSVTEWILNDWESAPEGVIGAVCPE